MAFDKRMEAQVETMKTVVMEATLELLSKMGSVPPSSEPAYKEIDIAEYEGRMRVGGVEKFNAPSYISVINYYSSPGDLERHKAKGALVVYVDSENAGKMFNSMGFRVPDDEDDLSMKNSCGEFAAALGKAFKEKFASAGYPDLVISAPHNYKNSVIEGVEFSTDQKTKCEFCFFYWKRKAVVVELTMTALPKR